MRYSRPFLIAMILCLLAMLTALGIMAPRMYPLHTASAADFWYAATGVDLGGGRGYADAIIFDRDRFVYGSQYPFMAYNDNPYQTISVSAAEADFPAVQKELARRAALNDPDDVPAAGYRKWLKDGPYSVPAEALLSDIERAGREHAAPNGWGFSPAFRNGLEHVGHAARWYYATVLFEAGLFGGLIILGFWPFIRRQSIARKYVHIGLLPLVLYLPMWLGYSNTASPYPWGGVLYPYVERWWPFDYYAWEMHLLSNLPPIFEAITQGRAVSYADYFSLRTSVPYQVGPVAVLALTGLLLALAATVHTCVWLFMRRREARPGFVVEPAIGRAGR